MKRFNVVLLLSLALLVVSGCATIPPKTDLKEDLKARVDDYWRLRIADRYEDAYAMEDTAGLPELAQYKELAAKIKRLVANRPAIGEITVDGDKGSVKLTFQVIIAGPPKPMKEVTYDNWVFKGGKWMHKFRTK